MSTVITRTGADYSLNASRYVPPITDGLVGWWYLGAKSGDTTAQGLSRTLRNLAGTSHTMSVYGSPTISTGYAQIDGSNGFQTTIPETDDFTWLLVCRPLAISGTLLAHRSGTSSTLLNNQASAIGTLGLYTPRDNGGISQQNVGLLATSPWSALKAISCRINATTGAAQIRNLTDATSDTDTVTGTRTLSTPATNLRIGGQATYSGAAYIAHVAVFDRTLTDGEEDTLYAFIANYFDQKYSVTI